MRECNYYEQILFLWERYDQGDSVRDQDYHILLKEIPYRGVLLNSGYGVVSRSNHEFLMGETIVSYPRFFILEPGHR